LSANTRMRGRTDAAKSRRLRHGDCRKREIVPCDGRLLAI
jgi:hypothetical protein